MTPLPDSDSLDVPFAISATHRIRFTHDVFGSESAVLSDVLEPSGEQPARVQFWIDAVRLNVSWASAPIDPYDMAPVLKRLMRLSADSTSSSGTGVPGLKSSRLRSVHSACD